MDDYFKQKYNHLSHQNPIKLLKLIQNFKKVDNYFLIVDDALKTSYNFVRKIKSVEVKNLFEIALLDLTNSIINNEVEDLKSFEIVINFYSEYNFDFLSIYLTMIFTKKWNMIRFIFQHDFISFTERYYPIISASLEQYLEFEKNVGSFFETADLLMMMHMTENVEIFKYILNSNIFQNEDIFDCVDKTSNCKKIMYVIKKFKILPRNYYFNYVIDLAPSVKINTEYFSAVEEILLQLNDNYGEESIYELYVNLIEYFYLYDIKFLRWYKNFFDLKNITVDDLKLKENLQDIDIMNYYDHIAFLNEELNISLEYKINVIDIRFN